MTKTKVLLIDDEVAFIATLGKRLDRRGFSVRTVGGGREALTAFGEENFDVVLLDIKMAGMDGIRTLQQIKQRYPVVEVLMLTAHANTDIVISSLAMGAFDYLLKPVEVDKLVAKIEEAAANKVKNLEAGRSGAGLQEER